MSYLDVGFDHETYEPLKLLFVLSICQHITITQKVI